ncbi:cellulose biosynthesis cyclic di-GMP-binding regulatory protein BcsB [Rhizobium tubonense]|uniref:Cyclic di-GMP-binding protein n=1 Tax=Rhizobium tubonense TaxID=484088 RepID=A0A2W4EXC6_9HYPH|nr:cellulose biosynthesis cyclic di-GMP-binding regulatory protein BcsB [Rhizobium tubonense]PZM14680.1 cellulose synthase BcsB subunit [Rhizobium tubonense]
MKTAFLTAAILAIVAPFAAAQVTPFDMSRERPAQVAPAPPAPPPVRPAPGATPVAPAPPSTQQVSPAIVPISPAQPPAPAAKPATISRAADFRRYLIPSSNFGLGGEIDRKSWSIYLTPEQAAAPAKLNFAYQNAVVVAPESSKLSVFVNNRLVGTTPIRSPDKASELSFDIPPNLLQPGSNLIGFEAEQRHRTDCSIESTYELWADVDPTRTYLSFGGSAAATFTSADGVRAVGVNEKGGTEFDFVVPALAQPGTTKPLMRLSQGLAVLSGMPNQSFSFQTTGLPEMAPGRLTVLVGTASELQPLVALPAAAQLAPLATFITDPHTGAPLLLVTGPSWLAVSSAVDSLVSPTDRSLDVKRDVLVTQRWRAPDAPLLFSNTDIPFAQLGVATTQFAGRRFRADFSIAVPADFYANAYGEATILLDAAYASTVLPGSHIDIYVNGSVASTVPITNSGGGIFRHLPIRVTMRHFRPGLNDIAVEASLLTSSDKACVPGATASADPRFALFDTSVFHMPDFARVGQRPNLAATGGTGYPYSRSDVPLPLIMDPIDIDTLSATATFLGRLAMMAGRPLAIDIATSPAGIGDRDALFVGSISQIPPTMLTQLNIATTSQATWRPVAVGQSTEVDTGATFEQWRSKVRGGSWSGQVSAFEEWMRRNFDISLGSLRFAPSAQEMFTPSNVETLMIAQGASPEGGGTWTLVTAPTSDDLRHGLSLLSREENWPQIAGRITTYASATKKIRMVPVTRFDFIPSQSPSFSNYRLIAANWLSTNILSYAMLFAASSVVLGFATAGLLSNLGRRR